MASRTLWADPRSAGNEETWSTLVAKAPSQGHAAVSATAAAAVLVSATEAEDGNASPWRPDNEHTFKVLFDVISSRRAIGPR